MSAKSDLYRTNVDECRRRAAVTSSPDARATWLELSVSWEQLLENERRWGWAERSGYHWLEMIGAPERD